jgi:hypothetical protein
VASRLANIGDRDRRGPQWHRSAGDRWHSQRSASRRGPGRGGPLAEADEIWLLALCWHKGIREGLN